MALADGHFVLASETPDASRAVVNSSDVSGIRTETAVFDIATGKLLVRGLVGLENSWALDDDELIGINEDSAGRYDIDTLEPISTLARATGGGESISVSDDGHTLLSVGYNHSLTLYDLTTDIPLAAPLPAQVRGVLGGFLTADGQTLLSQVADGIAVWDLRPAEQAAKACAIAGRELTPEEWSTYFPDEEQIDTCAALVD